MSNIVKRHNFDNSLRKIKGFAESLPTAPTLERYRTDGGLFGWGDHYINGREMNSFVKTLQKAMIDSNSVMVKTISEFSEVYKTFDYLDKEYISGIVVSVEAAAAASSQAKEAATKALHNEQDLRDQFRALKQLVSKLDQTKRELSLKTEAIESNLKKVSEQLSQTKRELSLKTEAIESNLKEVSEQLSKTTEAATNALHNEQDLREQFRALKLHVYKLDQTKRELSLKAEAIESNLKEVSEQLSKAIESNLKEVTEQLSKAIESNLKEVSEQLSKAKESYTSATETTLKAQEFYDKATALALRAQDTYSEATLSASKADQIWAEATNQIESAKTALEKRLWIAYGVAGVSLIVSIISLCI